MNHPQIVHEAHELRTVEIAISNERHQLLEEVSEQSSSNLALRASVGAHKMLVRKLEQQQLKESDEHNASCADNQLDKTEQLLLTKEEMHMEKMHHDVEVEDSNKQVDIMQKQVYQA